MGCWVASKHRHSAENPCPQVNERSVQKIEFRVATSGRKEERTIRV